MVTHGERAPSPGRGMRVAYTRGNGCAELASVLADREPVRVTDDVVAACVRAKADVLVGRKVSSFDLTNLAVPHDFDPDRPERVTGLVGTGPHSLLAGRIAARLGEALALPADLATAYTTEAERLPAVRAMGEVSRAAGLEGRLVAAPDVSDLLGEVGSKTLLVLGAAGGGILQRLFFGPGVRLAARAPTGAVVVKAAPMRVFRRMVEPVFVAGHMTVGDAARLTDLPVVAVVVDGRFTGIVRREILESADRGMRVSEVTEPGVSVSPEDQVETILAESGTPLPVTDRHGVLVGTVWI